MYLLNAKTSEGFMFKTTAELLQNIVKTASFMINNDGIRLSVMDSRENILINILFQAEKFDSFEFDVPFPIGINLNHLYRMLKSLKKKDSLCLYILESQPNKLFLKVFPKEHNRVYESSIHIIQNVQQSNIEHHTGYSNPIRIPSNEYQRSLKDMNQINNTMKISMKNKSVMMQCTNDNIYSRSVQFGDLDDDSNVVYTDMFDIDQFIRTIKVTGLNKEIEIYGQKASPLLLKAGIGKLGTIEIYVKPKEKEIPLIRWR